MAGATCMEKAGDRAMSWARGFFRGWVAVSILWAGFTAWVAFPSLARNWSPDYSFNLDTYLHGTRPPSSLEQGWRAGSPVVSTPPTQQEAEAVARWLWSNKHLKGSSDYEEKVDQLGAIHRTLYDRETKKRLSDFSKALLIPPAVLLMVGALLAWVIAGFRRGERLADNTDSARR